MNSPESNQRRTNDPEPSRDEAEQTEDAMESSTNTSWVMPAALLLVLLVIPFSINSFMHMLAEKGRYVHPVIMKIPIDGSMVTAPVEAKQFEGFSVKLNVNTDQLAKFINEIVSIASTGTSVHGITGFVSSKMNAEITGEGFDIENPGPIQQMYVLNDSTEWTWQVVPQSSGTQTIKFKMHVTSSDGGEQEMHVIDIAEANVRVDSNRIMWMVYNWWILALVALVLFGGWKMLRRYNV